MNKKSEEKRKLIYMLTALEEMLKRDYADIKIEHKDVCATLELLQTTKSENVVVFYSEKYLIQMT